MGGGAIGPQVTRLAPSPTGALHLGNARTFLVNWLLARKHHWRIILRIEDLDGPRLKPGADAQAMRDLQWLGLDWDEGPIYQSARLHLYADALQRLRRCDRVYPNLLSRREQERLVSAPHADDSAPSPEALANRTPAWHFRSPRTAITFVDGFCGPQLFQLRDDFAVAKADGLPSYQLAVTVDDANMGITQVVRGDDLLDSTARQLAIFDALDLTDRTPTYIHLPLIVGPDGRRLAKRHGDTRLDFYRNAGVSADRMRALLLRWCGQEGVDDTAAIDDWIERFDLARLPRQPIVFTAADDAWLRRV